MENHTVHEELTALVDRHADRLHEISEELASDKPSPEQWSVKEILGHLVDSAANNHQRFVRAQFTAFLSFPEYKQNQWVASQRYDAYDWQSLVELWRLLNRHLAHVLRHVPPEALEARCVIGEKEPTTLMFLMEDYVDHLEHHLRQIAARAKLEEMQ